MCPAGLFIRLLGWADCPCVAMCPAGLFIRLLGWADCPCVALISKMCPAGLFWCSSTSSMLWAQIQPEQLFFKRFLIVSCSIESKSSQG